MPNIEIDAENDELLTFLEAARWFSRRGVNVSIIHRWRLKGIRGVKLPYVVIGGTYFTSRRALKNWYETVRAGRAMEWIVCPARSLT